MVDPADPRYCETHTLIYGGWFKKDRYFPDFVAFDTNGVHWIIEGKDERGRDDTKVQAKRKAAKALVRRLVAEDAYTHQKWGYLIAYRARHRTRRLLGRPQSQIAARH